MARARPNERRVLAQALGLDTLTAQCLINRGLRDPDDAQQFLRASLADLLQPDTLPDIQAAVARIRKALSDGETICVWGDYDVDGISGTALLTRFLRLRGGRVIPFIPERTGSGYGFHWETMERLIEQGVSLFISVDHGSTAVDCVRQAGERGVDVVIADHHEMSPKLPAAVAVINPKRADSSYAFPHLCGAGVAMKLAWAVAQDLSPGTRVSDDMRDFLTQSLAIAVLGTVADVVPLLGENRSIVKNGLAVLGTRPLPGIAALLDVSRIRGALKASDVGFRLGPRINAAGRMGRASLALELLLTDDTDRAREIAETLDHENDRRRKVEQAVADEAVERAAELVARRPGSGIALMSDGWHHGVIGIVASRLVDRFHLPTVLVGVHDGLGRGSARSVPGFALHTALAACGEHLVKHGGHAAAAGLSVEPGRFEAFADAFHEYVAENLSAEDAQPRLDIDAEVEMRELRPGMVASLERLAPFGQGNPEPVLALRGVRIAGKPRRMGSRDEHIAFHVATGGEAIRMIAFRRAERYESMLKSGGLFDVAFTVQRNGFRGRDEVEGLVRDIKPAG